ncbi:9412_t:CDS:1, partial [Acaulospora colombiana]
SYVCGGLAGELVLTSKSTLSLGGLESMFGFSPIGTGGHAQKVLHSGEGPVWTVRWRGDTIAWANDTGVRLYSVSRGEKVGHIVRPRDSPRADLFQCTLQWASDAELIIGWANRIEIVHISTRPKAAPQGATGNVVSAGAAGIGVLVPTVSTEVVVHIDKVLTLECMAAGVVPWPFKESAEDTHQKVTTERIALPTSATTAPIPTAGPTSTLSRPTEKQTLDNQKRTNAFLLLAYLPSSNLLSSESTNQRRVAASPPELQIINTAGEEESMDVLGIKGYERWSCSDYRIIESFQPPSTGPLHTSTYKTSLAHKSGGRLKEKDHGGWLVLSPQGIVHIRKRDRRDRVMWLVERERYEEALDEMEKMEKEGDFVKPPL